MWETDKKYLMPVAFGPSAGPRQRPDGALFEDAPTHVTRFAVRYLSDAAAIQNLLPDGLQLWGEPIVTVELAQLRDVSWLAGRGYNTLGVRLPARFDGQKDCVKGQYLAVLWENLTDPIITGREQLGYPKIYASISDARKHHGAHAYSAHWLGFSFVDVELTATREIAADERKGFVDRTQAGEGLILHKYLPKTGAPWTESAENYFTFAANPSARNRQKMPAPPVIRTGTGQVQFHRPRWQDMPTQHHIVNALADLPVREWREASIIDALDYSDYNDQRILR